MIVLKLAPTDLLPDCPPDPSVSEAVTLGVWASERELWAELDPWLPDREREGLLTRADRYRDLQLVALANFAESNPTQPTDSQPADCQTTPTDSQPTNSQPTDSQPTDH